MTELIWEGKYSPDGKKTPPFRFPLPFQDVETVNEAQSVRARQLDLFSQARETEWRNRLIWGDKKYVLPSLLPEFAGKVNLIYIDPPFATGADFSHAAIIPDDPFTEGDQSTEFTKQPSIIEQKAYRDTWGRGLDSYLQWFYETAVLLHELLSEEGSIYVHIDWHMEHYAKIILDEVFGHENFVNEVVWKRRTGTASSNNGYGVQTDSLLFYSKSQTFTFKAQHRRIGVATEEIEKKFNLIDEQGRRYWSGDLGNPADRPNLKYQYKGYAPPKNGWAVSLEVMQRWDTDGKLIFPKDKAGRIRRKMFLDDWQGYAVQNLWDDISPVQPQAGERVNYATQKPEALLDRIIKASSNEGDLVLDCFCGSGTTAAVAEKLGRRWITSDLGRFAIHTARKRLLSIDGARPFVVQNLGKYERQQWQAAEFGEGGKTEDANRQTRYRRFILDLYGAEPLEGYTWLHGVKAGRMVYVGSVDAPVTLGEIKQISSEFWRASGESLALNNGVDVLGWDFAFELNEMGKQMAAEANVDLKFKRIPREVLEKKAVQQGDIQFFELAALSVRYALDGKRLTLDLIDFVVNPDDVPPDVQKAVTHWTQWVDYWAIDWDYKDDTFHNQWQHYRTKRDPKLVTQAAHTYEDPGKYTVVVKVIDLLGNDTTRALTLEVG